MDTLYNYGVSLQVQLVLEISQIIDKRQSRD